MFATIFYDIARAVNGGGSTTIFGRFKAFNGQNERTPRVGGEKHDQPSFMPAYARDWFGYRSTQLDRNQCRQNINCAIDLKNEKVHLHRDVILRRGGGGGVGVGGGCRHLLALVHVRLYTDIRHDIKCVLLSCMYMYVLMTGNMYTATRDVRQVRTPRKRYSKLENDKALCH